MRVILSSAIILLAPSLLVGCGGSGSPNPAAPSSVTMTFRKYDMGGFKGTFTFSGKRGDSITVRVADYVPAGDDPKRVSVRSPHTDLPGARVGFTTSGTLALTAPSTDTTYDAFFFPQIDTTVYWRGLTNVPGLGSPVNYGCLDLDEPKVSARPTVAGIYTPGMNAPGSGIELRAGAEPAAFEAVRRLNEAWRTFPDFAIHRIDLNPNATNAPFMMGLLLNSDLGPVIHSPTFVLVDPGSSGPYDPVESMVTETFHALFFGSAGGPCWTTTQLLNPENPDAAGISEVGRMVLYYYAAR